jgi:hypothetical protein
MSPFADLLAGAVALLLMAFILRVASVSIRRRKAIAARIKAAVLSAERNAEPA